MVSSLVPPPPPSRFLVHVTAALLASLAISSCGKKEQASTTPNTADQGSVNVEAMHQNNLGNSGSSFLASQANSPVHWQLWGKHVFEQAKLERKTVMVLVGSGSDANSLSLLRRINQSPATCHLLNRNHINVLADKGIHPALDYYAAILCAQSNAGVAPPMLIWFSYEGNPLSWTPCKISEHSSVSELISRLSGTVQGLWRDDPEYVLTNSREDFLRRLKRNTPSINEEEEAFNPVSKIRKAASLYDPTSHSIDHFGPYNSSQFIQLMANASACGAIPHGQRLRYARIARLACQNILIHGLIDPIDGGVWAGMQRSTTALPMFTKHLRGQTRAMQALYTLYQLTEDKIYLDAANRVLSFTEQHLGNPGGGYSEGIIFAPNQPSDNLCLWTLEELEQLLTEQELRICTLAFGIKGLGNIPMVDDKNRTYFRKNTLTWKLSKKELQKKTQLQRSELDAIISSMTRKLHKARSDRGPILHRENMTTLRSISAYCSALTTAFRATGDPKHLEKAKQLFHYIDKNFRDTAGDLREARNAGKLVTQIAGANSRSFLCAAALDLLDATHDLKYLESAHQIHTRMNSMFLSENGVYLVDQNYSGFPANYQIVQLLNLPPLGNDSTIALAWSNTSRLLMRKKDDKLTSQKKNLGAIMGSKSFTKTPIMVDYLASYAYIHWAKVVMQDPANAGLTSVAVRRPCHVVVLPKGSSGTLLENSQLPPAGSAAVKFEGKITGTTNDTSELRKQLK